ncbi:hypothetical protein [Streptomyces halstedii]|uniref:hypothetical protein n=1 Tax=Streptomyces halstedii TaxID=1944 RepID=UPI00335E57ED
MAKFVLLDARLFAGAADLSGASNKIEIKAEIEEKDTTNYRSRGWKEVLGALGGAELSGAGQWEAGDPGLIDNAAWAQLGGRGPWTAGPVEANVGALAYVMYGLQSSYGLGDQVGEVAPWNASVKSSWPLARGQFAHSPGIARTGDGDGAGIELGPIAARQRLYASLHVLSVAGTAAPTLTVDIESDATDAFADPAPVASFAPAAAPGGQIVRTAGDAVTDSWYRASWTISGTSPSFMFVVALGIA